MEFDPAESAGRGGLEAFQKRAFQEQKGQIG